jgi:glycosyltransferase involved in cell wall biosynthesis
VNALTYAADPTADSLVGVVPFGVPDEEFAAAAAASRERAGGAVMKGARPGIRAGDKVLFWGGSLLDWQDPLTLVRAIARIAESRDDVKLFFAGVRHPNPQVAPMRMVEATRTLASKLGVLDRHVFLNDWIPYEQRAAYLEEADLGVSTHRLHLETHFSFRTRFVDYLWASLPVVCTEGDYFADLVRSRGLGLVVPPGDHVALADAILLLLDHGDFREQCRMALQEVRDEFRWSRVAEPLRRFAAAPRFAADHEPAVRQVRARLRRGYRVSRWAKRTALRLGVSEARVEQLKATPPVQVAMRIRNQIALARAGKVRN